MGTEYLRRFDWGLAARIRRMEPEELAGLLAERYPAWRASGRPACSEVLRLAARSNRPVPEVLDELLAEDCTLTELRNDAIYDLCLQGEDVRLGEGGAWDEVFAGGPGEALSSLEILPGTDEELFLLLQPWHLDAILRSLAERSPEPAVRSRAQLDAIAQLRDTCAARPGLLVAYCFEA